MDAELFGKEFYRMCKSFGGRCNGCGVFAIKGNSCLEIFKEHPKEVIEIVKKWSKEHPIKTRADKFKEVFDEMSAIYTHNFGDNGFFISESWWNEPYEEPKDLVQLALDEFGYNGHTLREWVNILTSGPIDGIWLCDPSKNSHCSSENCYKNGGRCYHTVYRQYAMFPMEENEKE